MKVNTPLYIVALLVVAYLCRAVYTHFANTTVDWAEYDGDGYKSHYSALDQINISTLGHLKPVWKYRSGGADTVKNSTQMQCNPLIIDGTMYGVSAGTQVFAINATTGAELWKTRIADVGGTTSRGVSFWKDSSDKRLFFGAGKWFYAINAINGSLVKSFGQEGRIDLQQGLQRPGSDNYVSSNTPNIIFQNLIITGARVSESETALLGDIRAFDVKTGKLIWTFHTIPMPGEPGYQTWSPANPRQIHGGTNSWMGMAIDRKRGIVFAPTGSAAYDFYGGDRKGTNLYADCLLALDANTGKKIWHFQLVHHDIWDRDPPAPPNLLTITQGGKKRDVVAIVTKQGYTFVFDRETGKPVFPIHERPVSGLHVEGEEPNPTQPYPEKPLPFTRQSFTEDAVRSPMPGRDSIIRLLKHTNTGTAYIPITGQTTIIYPGTDGGAQWGGAAISPDGMIFIPAKEIPVYTSLVPTSTVPENGTANTGAVLYQMYCSPCHGADRLGNHDGTYPALVTVKDRYNDDQVGKLLKEGRGMMPSFSHISDIERKAIIDYLFDKTSVKDQGISIQKSKVPFHHTGYNRWYASDGHPINTPPWGTLTAIDLNSGNRQWQVPLGGATGTDNYGGPLVTQGGLIFIAATPDRQFHAFERKSGKLLWEYTLPAAGYATPSTYSVNGKQYIVIACGGGKLNSKSGDQYVAFALEE